jgi:hypothetical protein
MKAPKATTAKRVLRTIGKRTSIGTNNRPKNKHKRKNWKAYRGQG